MDYFPDFGTMEDVAGAAVEAAPAVADVASAATDLLFRYQPVVDSLWSRFSAGPDLDSPVFRNLADTTASLVEGKGGGPKPVDSDGIVGTFAKWLGFAPSEGGKNAAAAALTGLVGSVVSGAARGAMDAPLRDAKMKQLESERRLQEAQAQAVAQKSRQDLSGLNIASGGTGLLFAPPKIVPVKTRTA